LIGGRYRFYERSNNVPHEIYTANTPHGMLLFTCNKENDVNLVVYPSCDVFEDLGNNVGVIFHVSRDYRLEAADIDAKLRALLTSFARK
jgi:hypothetical protein